MAPGDSIYFRVLAMTCLYGALAFAWNLHALTGVVSLGHAAFFGLGAYGSALAVHYWKISPWWGLLLGGGAGAAYGVAWAVVFRNLRGPYLALATLASVQVPQVIIDNWESVTFGSLGVVGIPALPPLDLGPVRWDAGEDPRGQYYLLLGFLLLVAGIHRAAISSRWGWAIRAVREDEVAASAIGVNVWGARFQTLVSSAFLTGLCGALYAHLIGLVEPPLVFSLHISAVPLVFTIFGGRYQAYGPFLGALVLYPLDQLLFHAWLPAGHAMVYGLVIVVAILCFPQGIAAWLQERVKSVWS